MTSADTAFDREGILCLMLLCPHINGTDQMDPALLMTSDSDSVPALYSLKRYATTPAVYAVVYPPIKRENAGHEMQPYCRELFGTKTRCMRVKQLLDWLFTDVVT